VSATRHTQPHQSKRPTSGTEHFTQGLIYTQDTMSTLLAKVWQFIKDSGKYGITSEIAALVLFLLTSIEHAIDKTFSPYPFLCVSVFLFSLGGFLAWSHKDNAEEVLQREIVELKEKLTDVPRLEVVRHGFYVDVRPLIEQIGPVIRTVAQLSCLHVKFKNDPELSTESSIAKNILAELEFIDDSSHPLCTLLGRWGDTPQPPHLPQSQSPAQALAMVDFGIGQEREFPAP